MIDVTLTMPENQFHLGDLVVDTGEDENQVGRIIGLGTHDGVVPFVHVKWIELSFTEQFIGREEISALKHARSK